MPSLESAWYPYPKGTFALSLLPFVNQIKKSLSSISPVRQMAMGYLSYVLFGWLLLALPVCHTGTGAVTSLAALFTATSAVSTTGLVTVSIGHDFNFLGQFVILLLIQLGGIGYMTFSSFICLARGNGLPLNRQRVGRVVFSLPDGFSINRFIRGSLVFSVAVETVGTVALYFAFMRANVENPFWAALFHSVSAFCTAGFSLWDSGMVQFQGDVAVNLIIDVLCYAGAIGFIVFLDFWRWLVGKQERITLTSRIILAATGWILLLGTSLMFICEPSIQALTPGRRLMAALFQIMNASTTAGFNSVSIGGLSPASLLLLVIVMIIGASPSGTGGGIKTTTISAFYGIIRSTIRGCRQVTFYNRAIPAIRLRAATAAFGFYVCVLFVGCYLLTLTDTQPFLKMFFEASSALGTVGLSTGITASFSSLGQLILVAMMFIGRLGPIAFGAALFLQREENVKPDEDLAV